MGIATPLASSDGILVADHQGHDIAAHLVRLERAKLRIKRQYARKLHAAADRAGAVTETGAFKKGVRIETSNRMRRAMDRLGKIERQIVGYRADWQRKQALQIVRENAVVVVEALTIQHMTRSAAGTSEAPGRNVRAKSALNRSILARGWGSMRQRLKSKAEEMCGRVIEVDPRHTSQTCPRCEHIDRDNRETQAQFACVACGYTGHADIVGALNILARGLSAGALPAAGRGGFATGSAPSGAAMVVIALASCPMRPISTSANAAGSSVRYTD
jgi:IS605 OrfB family transposase